MTTPVTNEQPIRVGLLGAGTVGSQTARLIVEQADELAARVGRPLELVGIAVLDPSVVNDPWIDKSLLTTDAAELCTRADIIIELIGGIEPARTFITKALESGASVVTANKAVLAECGAQLYEIAEKNNVDLYFEAAVGGAIPIVRPLRESLVGDEIVRIMGIVNGTTNYILDEMTTKGLSFDVALKDAQAKGFAEANPTADIDGFDAAAKAAIMACLAFQTDVSIRDVTIEGIRHITAEDIQCARDMNSVIKLLAVVERRDNGITAGVYPAIIPDTHPLAAVHGSFNAVFVEAAASDDLMFYGRGAGGAPTAGAVVGDVVTVARHIVGGTTGPAIPLYANLPIADASHTTSSFVLRLLVKDQPGVLAQVAQILANHDISIDAVRQRAQKDEHDLNELWITTHPVSAAELDNTINELEHSDSVDTVLSKLRVLSE